MGTTQNSTKHILICNWKMKWKQARQTIVENGQVKTGLLNKHLKLPGQHTRGCLFNHRKSAYSATMKTVFI